MAKAADVSIPALGEGRTVIEKAMYAPRVLERDFAATNAIVNLTAPQGKAFLNHGGRQFLRKGFEDGDEFVVLKGGEPCQAGAKNDGRALDAHVVQGGATLNGVKGGPVVVGHGNLGRSSVRGIGLRHG